MLNYYLGGAFGSLVVLLVTRTPMSIWDAFNVVVDSAFWPIMPFARVYLSYRQMQDDKKKQARRMLERIREIQSRQMLDK